MRNIIKECLQEEMSVEELLDLIKEVESEIEEEERQASIEILREDAAATLEVYLNSLDKNMQVTIEEIYGVLDSVEKSVKLAKRHKPVIKTFSQEDFSDMLKRLGF